MLDVGDLLFDEDEPSPESVPGVEPAAVEPFDCDFRDELLGNEPSAIGADFAWNVSTATRPATVAPTTIGVLLIELLRLR